MVRRQLQFKKQTGRRRRFQYRALRARRVVAQAITGCRIAHAGGNITPEQHARVARLGGFGAAFRTDGKESLYVVVIPKSRLEKIEPRPQARSYLGDTAAKKGPGGAQNPQRGARLDATFRPCAGDGGNKN